MTMGSARRHTYMQQISVPQGSYSTLPVSVKPCWILDFEVEVSLVITGLFMTSVTQIIYIYMYIYIYLIVYYQQTHLMLILFNSKCN
jgi:hypothetical protein